MKLCVISDSHLDNEKMVSIREKWAKDCSYFFHCGDSMLEPHSPYLEGYEVVAGNNDYLYPYPNEIVKQIENDRLLVIHGHQQYVKFEMNTLYYYAKERQVNLVFYGHTHITAAEVYDDILFLNPGSIRYASWKGHPTYAVVDLEKRSIDFYDAKTHFLLQNSTF